MDISIDSLIPYHDLQSDPERVFSIVEKNGNVVLLKDNKPAYLLLKYKGRTGKRDLPARQAFTLHEAMKLVLSEAPDHTMHARDLADEIYDRGLYVRRDGDKAPHIQIRATCSHYKHLFEAIPGNLIKLREDVTEQHG